MYIQWYTFCNCFPLKVYCCTVANRSITYILFSSKVLHFKDLSCSTRFGKPCVMECITFELLIDTARQYTSWQPPLLYFKALKFLLYNRYFLKSSLWYLELQDWHLSRQRFTIHHDLHSYYSATIFLLSRYPIHYYSFGYKLFHLSKPLMSLR